MFYTYRQNNSGGYWEFDNKDGIAIYVIVEAPNDKIASLRFLDIVSCYSDFCECCGERWYEGYPDKGEAPMIYDKTVEDYITSDNPWYRLSDDQHRVAIHYLDGTIKLIK